MYFRLSQKTKKTYPFPPLQVRAIFTSRHIDFYTAALTIAYSTH